MCCSVSVFRCSCTFHLLYTPKVVWGGGRVDTPWLLGWNPQGGVNYEENCRTVEGCLGAGFPVPSWFRVLSRGSLVGCCPVVQCSMFGAWSSSIMFVFAEEFGNRTEPCARISQPVGCTGGLTMHARTDVANHANSFLESTQRSRIQCHSGLSHTVDKFVSLLVLNECWFPFLGDARADEERPPRESSRESGDAQVDACSRLFVCLSCGRTLRAGRMNVRRETQATDLTSNQT